MQSKRVRRFFAGVIVAGVLVVPVATAAGASAESKPVDEAAVVAMACDGKMDTQLFDYHSIADARKATCSSDSH